jgi:hypothetical protein
MDDLDSANAPASIANKWVSDDVTDSQINGAKFMTASSPNCTAQARKPTNQRSATCTQNRVGKPEEESARKQLTTALTTEAEALCVKETSIDTVAIIIYPAATATVVCLVVCVGIAWHAQDISQK